MLKPLLPGNKPAEHKKKKRKKFDTSFMQQYISKDAPYARKAYQYLIDFINEHNLNIKTAVDMMAGMGVFTEHILRIQSLETLVLNDLADDCYHYLQGKFQNNEKIKAILQQDYININFSEKIDLVVIDFNNFTWNKEALVHPFLNWLEHNRSFFSYLLYCDSYYYSLKFVKDKAQVGDKYKTYLKQAEKRLNMHMLTHYVYKNKNCGLVLLENQGRG